MKKIIDHVNIVSSDIESVMTKCIELVNLGWEPFGGVIAEKVKVLGFSANSYFHRYTQIFVKYEDSPEKISGEKPEAIQQKIHDIQQLLSNSIEETDPKRTNMTLVAINELSNLWILLNRLQ
jgi:hypothetical protein